MTVNQLKRLLENVPGHEELFDDDYNRISIGFYMSEDNEGYRFLKMFVVKEP